MKKVKLSLEGINGNAFVIMGTFMKAAKKQGWTEKEIDDVILECKSGDYDHLIQTIMSNIEDED